MLLIVGLGNPGKKYEKTRHNIGFMVLDRLIKDLRYRTSQEKSSFSFNQNLQSAISIVKLNNQKIILAKPQTYMNLSGKAVKKLLSYYKVDQNNLWLIYDDIDLPLGAIRIRQKGSSGGHKGVQSVLDEIKTDYFVRFRIGIGSNRYQDISSEKYVLQRFTSKEKEMVEKILDQSVDLLLECIKKGVKEKTVKLNPV